MISDKQVIFVDEVQWTKNQFGTWIAKNTEKRDVFVYSTNSSWFRKWRLIDGTHPGDKNPRFSKHWTMLDAMKEYSRRKPLK